MRQLLLLLVPSSGLRRPSAHLLLRPRELLHGVDTHGLLLKLESGHVQGVLLRGDLVDSPLERGQALGLLLSSTASAAVVAASSTATSAAGASSSSSLALRAGPL